MSYVFGDSKVQGWKCPYSHIICNHRQGVSHFPRCRIMKQPQERLFGFTIESRAQISRIGGLKGSNGTRLEIMNASTTYPDPIPTVPEYPTRAKLCSGFIFQVWLICKLLQQSMH